MTDIPQWLADILRTRHISSADIDYKLANLLPPQMLGIDAACTLLIDALRGHKRIVIVGDYDVDGATATVVLLEAMVALGFEHVEFLVPNRFTDGYGLTPNIVSKAKQQFQADIIITVDNGIASHHGVDHAQSLGCKVIITDHHLPGLSLPAADAIVNPNQPNCPFASKNLAGVGVAFYLMLALRKKLREQQWFMLQSIREPNLAEQLDLVALGTVADMVPLDYNNRVLVAAGLRRIQKQTSRPGILHLLRKSQCVIAEVDAETISFQVAPKINAVGRMADMTIGIRCLASKRSSEAHLLADDLVRCNHERRATQKKMMGEAQQIVLQLKLPADNSHPAMCLFQADWHQGLTGLVAGRIKDIANCPVVVFAQGDDGCIKGSARSISSVHIRDTLEDIFVNHANLIEQFGGHAMAAGLTIRQQHFAKFSQLFCDYVAKRRATANAVAVQQPDARLPAQALTIENARLIKRLTPWGVGFAPPLFEGVFIVQYQNICGGQHLQLVLTTDTGPVSAIAFFIDVAQWHNRVAQVAVTYRLGINHYNGSSKLQLMLQTVEPVAPAE